MVVVEVVVVVTVEEDGLLESDPSLRFRVRV